MAGIYLGLMSGTSMNGVDAAAVRFEGTRFAGVLATASCEYAPTLRARLLQLVRERGALTLAELGELDRQVAERFTAAALSVLERASLRREEILAIGSHGQTVHHQTRGPSPSTLQLGDPNLIAVRTGLTVVADFRRRDIALGGQGAPLVPAFHHALFASTSEERCVVNIGGIANVTLLDGGDPAQVRGFDTGPGNALMDEWIAHCCGADHDEGGALAAKADGPSTALLEALLAEPYFARPPPKSTGRDQFNLEWARRCFPGLDELAPEVVQRSFCELTARTIASAVTQHPRGVRRLLVCGGGVRNRVLMERLRAAASPAVVVETGDYGLDAQWVEAAAFAWLAMRTMNGLPGNLPAVTGAQRLAVLGGIYRA